MTTEVACAGPACTRLIRPQSRRHRFCSRNCSARAKYREQHGDVRAFTVAPVSVATPGPTDIAWSAGFLDGEGAFQVQARRVGVCKTRYIVAAAQVAIEPLLRLQQFWGGRIQGPSDHGANHSPIYQWSVSGPSAAALVRAIRPFLAVKGRQADLMLAYADLPGVFEKGYSHGRRLSEADAASRRAIAEAVCRLNRKGVARVAA